MLVDINGDGRPDHISSGGWKTDDPRCHIRVALNEGKNGAGNVSVQPS